MTRAVLNFTHLDLTHLQYLRIDDWAQCAAELSPIELGGEGITQAEQILDLETYAFFYLVLTLCSDPSKEASSSP